MTEDGAWPACQHSRHPPTLHADAAVTNGIHTAMNEVKRTAPQPRFSPPHGDSQLGELPARHHPMLSVGDRRNRGVRRRPAATRRAAFAVILTVNARLAGSGLHQRWSMAESDARVARRLSRLRNVKETPARRYRLWL